LLLNVVVDDDKCEKKTKFIKDGYSRRSCTSKTAKKSPFRYICNVLFRHTCARHWL